MSVWYWPPNSMSETLGFRTEVLPSRTTERRVSYADGIQTLSYGYVSSPRVAEEMTRLFLSDTEQTFLVPEWPTCTLARTGSIAVTDTIIPVDDVVVYAVGQQVIIGSGDLWEQAEVLSIGASSITLTAGVGATYAASAAQPTFVAPLINCICPEGIVDNTSYPIRGVNLKFLSTSPIDIPANPYSTYDGAPFVTDGFSMFGPLAGGNGRRSILFDTGFGGFEIGSTEDYTRRAGTLSFFDATYADRMELRRFLHFMRGKDGEMWVTSGQPELLLNAGVASNALSFSVQPVAPAADMVGTVVNFSEGSNTTTRTITGATDVSPTAQTLEIAVTGTTYTTAATVSFMRKCRFDTDEFVFQYRYSADGLLATVETPILEVV